MEFHRGDLLPEEAGKAGRSALQALRRPPIALDATLDAILQTLDKAEKDPIP
jgi:hypothetical protein